MSKYIIDIDDNDIQKIVALGVTNCGAVYTRKYDIDDDIEELTIDYIKENCKSLLNAEYQRGFEDGKAVDDKGCVGCKFEGNGKDHSPCDYCCNGYSNQYQAKQTDDEIKVGDEVEISQSDENGVWVVIKVEKHDDYEAYCAINKDGDIYFEEEQDRVTKTGRHFDIASILKEMQL